MQENFHYATDLILIGPICAGKSTLAPLLAKSLHLPRVSMDEIFGQYCQDQGYEPDFIPKAMQEKGALEVIHTLVDPLEVSALEYLLQTHHHCLIDLGAGHTHYEDEHLFQRVRQALAPYQHIVLLLPSPDPDESVRILRERSIAQRGRDWIFEGYDFIEHWVKDPCNYELATHIVYTNGKTPAHTHDEILQLLC